MKQIANELRRFLYAPWMYGSLAAALGFLLFYFVKMYAGQDAQSSLLFLLSDRKYFGILYALLALFIFGLDVESGAVEARIMAGQSIASIVIRKSLIYFVSVLIFCGIYSAVCLRVCNISLVGVWQTLLIRLLMDLGAAAIFIPMQFLFRTLQPTLIISTVSAAVFIFAAEPRYELWYAVLQNDLPFEMGLAHKLIAIVSISVVAIIWVELVIKRSRKNGK